MGDHTDEHIADEQVEVEPWFAVWSPDGTWPGQPERHAELAARMDATFGERVFLAKGAAVACESLRIGERVYVATGCVLRDRIEIGDDCTLNPYVVMAGKVRLGNGVRIASFAALYGFNHRFDDLDTPIWLQDLDEQGIVVGDDVWIGTHAVVCDGVSVGDHSVIAAGAVVTTDVPPWSVVAGVPARVLRDRRDPPVPPRTGPARRAALSRFDESVAEQWPLALERCRGGGSGPLGYLDSPGAARTVRATCDAVEIAAAFGAAERAGDGEAGATAIGDWLLGLQDPDTGLFPDPAEGLSADPLELDYGREFQHYGVLSVGYALECLGRAPSHPVHVVEGLSSDELLGRLDALPWEELAWPAGAWVDFWGTAVHLNRRHQGSVRGLEALLGWLATRADPRSGMWGGAHRDWGWLMPVNGFYRLARGTYAQFGHALPYPEAAIDTVAAHCRDNGWFVERNRSACNVLDVVHPFWLCARQTDHRRPELRDRVAAMLDDTLRRWVPGEGFAFEPGAPTGLQGTEMWLAIVHLMADYLGESDGLSFVPRGVHRLPPAGALTG